MPTKDLSALDDNWYKDVVISEIRSLLEEYGYDDRKKAADACEDLLG